MDRLALLQPLVSRPPYGEERVDSEPTSKSAWDWGTNGSPVVLNVGAQKPVAESGLPQGDPGGKGIGLNKDIPGESTYNKPEGDTREFDKAPPGSIYRIDGPDDRAKPQDNPEGDERHHEDFKPRIEPEGAKPTEEITKYPYRDGLPHQHYASTAFVAGRYLAEHAHTLRVAPGNRLLVASKPDDIVNGLNPTFQERAKQCGVTLKRVDSANLRWLFSVDCGNGPKVVKLKAFRSANVVRLGKMDVDLSCSCPAWQWLGPEHHAKREDYLDGTPRGTASTPVVRDPQGINRVCKHVAAVLSFAQGWEVPAKAKKK